MYSSNIDVRNERIQKALASADVTKYISFGHGVINQTGSIFKQSFPSMNAIIVADENTWDVCGEVVRDSLAGVGVEVADTYIFPSTPTLYGSYENVTILREYLTNIDGIACSLAAGSLNDITKLASHELNRPYMNVCTAASVDGFASFGASISKDGFKITRECNAPVAIVADLEVMATAPQRLTATGYGDLIEKIPAGADWLLSDILGIESVDQGVWKLVQNPLREALANPEIIATNDPNAIAGLAEGNIMSGLAMQAYSSSRPASGAGHQFSHIWEMEGHGLDTEPPLSHGFKVGIGAIASCALWEWALNHDFSEVDIDDVLSKTPSREELVDYIKSLHDNKNISVSAVEQSLLKYLDRDELVERITLIRKNWSKIVEVASQQLISPREAQNWLKSVKAPYEPEHIGISNSRLRETYYKAPTIRSRYTIFDLLLNLQVFDQAINELFSPNGFWFKG